MSDFSWEFELQDHYVFCRIKGRPTMEGLIKLHQDTSAMARVSENKRLLIDASEVESCYSLMGKVRDHVIDHAYHFDRTAAIITRLDIYTLAKFIILITGNKTLKIFRSRLPALRWLLA